MNITTKDIAKICGVSRGTVDRALHNKPGINQLTRDRILRVIGELHYRPHHLARSLVKGQTYTIGVIVWNLYHRYFSQLVHSIEKASREHGYGILLAISDRDPDREFTCLDQLAGRQMDGIIIMSVNKGQQFEQYLKSLNIPIVTIGNKISNYWPYIGINDRGAMREAVYFLKNKGYTHIKYISPPLALRNRKNMNLYTWEERLKGYKDAYSELFADNKPIVIKTENYAKLIEEIELQPNQKQALLFSSDLYALEALNQLKKQNFKVPKEIGIMGFDNIDILKYISPSLTTVEYPVMEIGREAINCLINLIKTRVSLKKIILNHKIIEGETV